MKVISVKNKAGPPHIPLLSLPKHAKWALPRLDLSTNSLATPGTLMHDLDK